jgi:hypothetical protein
MKHRPSPVRTTVRRSLASLAVVASLALLVALGSACVIGEAWESDDSRAALPDIDCSGLAEWQQNIAYPAGHVVTDTGDAFSARVAHTSFAPDWNPKRAASLWLATGHCVNGGGAGGGGAGDGGGGGGVEQPPPPADDDDEQIPPPAEGCQLNGRPGPLFDPAGAKNVGNGNGEQFIGGQCLDASDCASLLGSRRAVPER